MNFFMPSCLCGIFGSGWSSVRHLHGVTRDCLSVAAVCPVLIFLSLKGASENNVYQHHHGLVLE
jgi:hypothetical protein